MNELIKHFTSKKSSEETMEEKYKKLLLLYKSLSHMIYKEDPKDVLDSLFQAISDYLDLDIYFNYIFDEATGKLHLMNSYGIDENSVKEAECLELGEFVCGTVAEEQERCIVQHVDESLDEKVQFIKGLGLKSYVCHPLMAYGKLIGTLSFGSFRRSTFSPEEIEFIYTICNGVAITLDRTFLIRDLKKSKEEAEKANRIKTEFLSMMSHEFRTPLNSILGFAQILEDDLEAPLSSMQEKRVKRILTSGRQLLKLINEMLDIARYDAPPAKRFMEPVMIVAMIRKCVDRIKPDAEAKGISITHDLTDVMEESVWGVSIRLEQVVGNLLVNAVKYNKWGGNIHIKCRRHTETVVLIIKDTGIGIPADELEHIFTPFYRIHNEETNIEGTGIGLAIVKKLINEMDGEAGVESVLGEGSTFWITMKLVHDRKVDERSDEYNQSPAGR
ncbi:GAF domain-containing sensor histidine kinase [Falsibacillus pallidus]|uniref:histidine kinase n=1 Tax=Falsibacillus pallidus TaxID=493781 RepID=A0A370G9Z9_9BACI|nr:GAF domain-containing sensor histidine kinase [Falsibacillus pallidus]RDI40020.1 signal transduction histidine kinase [Falsibacillus pallidus]